jgi:hypothetical protein
MRPISLAKFGLETVADACARKGWAPKTVQNWVNAGLMPAVPVGGGRGTFLLVIEEVNGFTPPPRGRPPLADPPQPAKKKPARKPRKGKIA